MAFFQSNTCAALTWDDDDVFRGVILERNGNTKRILRFWQTEKIGSYSREQVIAQAIPALGITNDTTVILGGNLTRVCFIDLKLPNLSPSDIRNALGFELVKYTPIPLEDLKWGYRVIGKIEGTDLNLVRVVYFPQEEWESWIGAASGVSTGVDMIIPPVAVLDPEMKGVDICLDPPRGNEEFFLLKSLKTGERQVACCSKDTPTNGAFGMGSTPLSKENLDLGDLVDISLDQQKEFSSSIILAMYGISDNFYQDRKHWIPLPLEMRPRRNRRLKAFTMILGAYLFLLLGIWMSIIFYHNNQELQELKAESQRLQDAVSRSKEIPSDSTFIPETFSTEVNDAKESMGSITSALKEVTELTTEKLWCTLLNWNKGSLRIELRGEKEAPEIALAMQKSSLLTNITMNKRLLGRGIVSYTINCRVKTQEELKMAEDEEKAVDDLLPEDDNIKEFSEEE